MYLKGLQEADAFLNMLHELSEMGAAMRKVMTIALCNPQVQYYPIWKFLCLQTM